MSSSSSSWPIRDFRDSSSESPIAAAAAALDGCKPVLDKRLLAVDKDNPDGAPDELRLVLFEPPDLESFEACFAEVEPGRPDDVNPPKPFISPL